MPLTAALTLLTTLIEQSMRLSRAIGAARSEGRDLTEAELDEVVAANDAAIARARAAIAAQRAPD